VGFRLVLTLRNTNINWFKVFIGAIVEVVADDY